MQAVFILFGALFPGCTARFQSMIVFMASWFVAITNFGCAPLHEFAYPEPNTCDLTNSESGHPGCLPPPGIFCEEPQEEASPDPRYVGQLLPSKESLGSLQPVCAPNSTRLVQEQDRKHVKDGAHAIGEQVGQIMAKCEQFIDGLSRCDDPTLAFWFQTDPQTLAMVLNKCAAELDKVPEMPEYEDPWLAGTARRAFEEGYGDGVDSVANRLLILELAIDTIEAIVLPEILMADVLITRAIRGSIAGLRRMPIFIPGAIGGGGAFLKSAPKIVVQAVKTGSSRALSKAMRLANKIRLPGEFAHHIVSHGDPRAAKSLDILTQFGIDVDEAVNGVFLPGYKKTPNPNGKAVHSTIHTDAYYRAVERRLKKATTQADVVRELRLIAIDLERGIMP